MVVFFVSGDTEAVVACVEMEVSSMTTNTNIPLSGLKKLEQF